MGQISFFSFYNPQKDILARFCVFWAITHQNSSRGLFSVLVWEKIQRSQENYISVYCERIFTKFKCTFCRLNHSWQIVCQSVQSFDFTGVNVSISP